jgi:hypothetical protein
MPAFYIYFIASLPGLQFGMRPPFSFEQFVKRCRDFISKEDMSIIEELPKLEIGGVDGISNETVKQWLMFDTGIRNELVKARSARLRRDPAKYLRMDGYSDVSITHIALSAYKSPEILDAEKTLDLARWNKLEELSTGHYFDSDTLFVYALKLLLLERWERIRQADKGALLEEVTKRS